MPRLAGAEDGVSSCEPLRGAVCSPPLTGVLSGGGGGGGGSMAVVVVLVLVAVGAVVEVLTEGLGEERVGERRSAGETTGGEPRLPGDGEKPPGAEEGRGGGRKRAPLWARDVASAGDSVLWVGNSPSASTVSFSPGTGSEAERTLGTGASGMIGLSSTSSSYPSPISSDDTSSDDADRVAVEEEEKLSELTAAPLALPAAAAAAMLAEGGPLSRRFRSRWRRFWNHTCICRADTRSSIPSRFRVSTSGN
jgi:hypothetical protein